MKQMPTDGAANNAAKTTARTAEKNTRSSKTMPLAEQIEIAKIEAGKTLTEIAKLPKEDVCVTDHEFWGFCVDLKDCLSDDAAMQFGDALSNKCRGNLAPFVAVYSDWQKQPVIASLLQLQDAYREVCNCNEQAKALLPQLLSEYADSPWLFVNGEPCDPPPDPQWDNQLLWLLPDKLFNRIGNAALGKSSVRLSVTENKLVRIVKDTCLANEYFSQAIRAAQEAIDAYTSLRPECRGNL